MAKVLKAILLLLALALPVGVPAMASANMENSGSESRIAAQQVAPSVSLATTGGVQVRLNSPVSVTATFSEPISGFTLRDISVSNGIVGNFAGSGAVYTFEVTPDAIGKVTVDIAAGVAEDDHGNGNTSAPQLSLGIPYDDDQDGGISRSEVITAIKDYFSNHLTRALVIQIIGIYFAGTPTGPGTASLAGRTDGIDGGGERSNADRPVMERAVG